MDKGFKEFLEKYTGKNNATFFNKPIDLTNLNKPLNDFNEFDTMCAGADYFLEYILDVFNSGDSNKFMNLIKNNPTLLLIFEMGYSEAEMKLKNK